MSRPAVDNGPYITCREVLDFVMAYVDDELDAKQRYEFERHLTVCRSCVNYLETYRATVKLGREAMGDGGKEPASGSVPAGLMQAIRAARKKG